MSHFLPPALLAMFVPRMPLPYKEPPVKNNCRTYEGVADCIKYFDSIQETKNEETNKPHSLLTKEQKKQKNMEKNKEKIEAQLKNWNINEPEYTANFTGDSLKTLFIGRLSYEVSEKRLKKEFESYGPIKQVIIPKTPNGRSCGYAFVEFDHSSDLKSAYKYADGKKIENRRIVVDVERGRTVKNWKPKRLGGGLGLTRVGSKEQNQRNSGRPDTGVGGRDDRDRRSGVNMRDNRDRGDMRDRDRRRRSRSPRRDDHRRRSRSRDRDRHRDHRGFRR